MLFQSRRSATVRTLCFCETLYLRRENYNMVAHHFPHYAKKVRKTAIKVMWSNLLTSNTLKEALTRAAEARDRANNLTAVSVGELSEQMHDLMGTMMKRMTTMEKTANEYRKQKERADEESEKLSEVIQRERGASIHTSDYLVMSTLSLAGESGGGEEMD